MPHLTLEYTSNIRQHVNLAELFSALHRVLAQVGGVRIENCKSRAVKHHDFCIGSGSSYKAFVHLGMTMLEGRPLALKQKVGESILRVLKDTYAPSMVEQDLQITVEIKDIQKATYFKVPEGTLSSEEGG
ncbi:MAG: 5-carboxymethyl-2-hydroxymuconate Delta-isomerase [Acidiferrobacterales bacterium]